MTNYDIELCARVAQLYYTYARAVDEGDIETLASIAVDDVALTRMGRTVVGRDLFLDVFRAQRDSIIEVAKHVITNVQAERVGGLVHARAYFEATLFDREETRRVMGQYADDLRDEDGTLRLVHKRMIDERVQHLPAASSTWPGVEASVRG
jgi:3-phenylpropionate/cinnamic acid dioxygenase small subunit